MASALSSRMDVLEVLAHAAVCSPFWRVGGRACYQHVYRRGQSEGIVICRRVEVETYDACVVFSGG